MTKRITSIPSTLASVEAKDSEKQATADLGIFDPSSADAEKAIAKHTVGESLDSKPHDCTCQYPAVRVRNLCGHPETCRYYARWAKARGMK